MRMRFRSKGTFIKYFISYLIVFLLPILFLLTYFYPKTSKVLRENAIESSEAMLLQISDNINLQISNFWKYPTEIHQNSHLYRTLFIEKDASNTYRIMQEMQKMFRHNTFIEKALIYGKKSGIFYSFPGSYREENFNYEKGTIYFPDWDKEEMLKELQELRGYSIRPVETVRTGAFLQNSKQIITFMLPLPYQIKSSFGVLMLLVAEDKFFQQYQSNENPYQFLIIDQKNNLIASSHNSLTYQGENFQGILDKEINQPYEFINLSGEEYLVQWKALDYFDLKILCVTSLKHMNSKINQLKIMTIILILIVLIAGTLVISFALRTNYRPIRNLREKALEFIDQELEELSEFEMVHYAFENLQQENRELVSKVMLNKNISFEYFFIQLLNGTLSKKEIIQQAKEHDIQFKEKVCSIIFYAEDRNIVQLLSQIKMFLDMLEWKEMNFYIIKGMQIEDFVVIATGDNEELLNEFIQILFEAPFNIKIGIGGKEEVNQLHHSYHYSLAALEASIFNEETNVVKYDHIKVMDSDVVSDLFSILENIEFAITTNDSEQFEKQLMQLIELMKTKVSKLSTLKLVYLNVYNVMAKELNSYDYDVQYYYTLDHEHLNMEQLETKLLHLSDSLIEEMKKRSDSNEIEEILTFIDENYTDYNLSVQSLADEFSMSYSNFSHFFKNNTGENFTAYVTNLRMQKAKELLQETDEPIRIIAERVGYANANSFTRTFKRVMKMTPGEFRELRKHKSMT